MLFLERVCQALNAKKVEYAIVGGLAVALHGAVRGTHDIDIIITLDEKSFVAAEEAMNSIGLTPRLPVTAKEVYAFRLEYITNRNLIAWSFHNLNDLSEVVDIIITDDLQGNSTVKKTFLYTDIKILSKSDLIKMKKRCGRPQDLIDIEALEKLS